jgi:hypothetical protein
MECDECELKFNLIQTHIEIFQSNFNEYMRINSGDSYSIDKLFLNNKEEKFELISSGFTKKCDNILAQLYEGKCETHGEKIINNIHLLKRTAIRLYESYIKKKMELNLILFDKERLMEEKENLCPNYSEINNTCSTSNCSKLYLDLENPNSLNDVELNPEQLLYLQEYLEIQCNEYNGDEVQFQQLLDVKDKIKNLNKQLHLEIEKGGELIQDINVDVNQSSKNIERANEELRQAALYRNKKNKLKLPLILGGILGVVGSVVPGIGNAIGIALGSGIGYAIAKAEQKAIQRIEPGKYKK